SPAIRICHGPSRRPSAPCCGTGGGGGSGSRRSADGPSPQGTTPCRSFQVATAASHTERSVVTVKHAGSGAGYGPWPSQTITLFEQPKRLDGITIVEAPPSPT